MPGPLPDIEVPLKLRLDLHLARNWPAYTATGLVLMPLAIEAGVPLAGTLGYLCAVAAISSSPSTLWVKASPPGPVRAILGVVGLNILMRSIAGR